MCKAVVTQQPNPVAGVAVADVAIKIPHQPHALGVTADVEVVVAALHHGCPGQLRWGCFGVVPNYDHPVQFHRGAARPCGDQVM